MILGTGSPGLYDVHTSPERERGDGATREAIPRLAPGGLYDAHTSPERERGDGATRGVIPRGRCHECRYAARTVSQGWATRMASTTRCIAGSVVARSIEPRCTR